MRKENFKLDKSNLNLLDNLLNKLESGFSDLPSATSNSSNEKEIESILYEVTELLKDNFPYFHPLYAGQMLKPPHTIARLAYMLSLWINPNNHALDGGRASSKMEKEAVAEIAKMLGWQKHLGHLTSGGTFANLEALWIAGQIHPGKKIIASSQAHYTHSRISKVLGLEFESVPCDNHSRIDIKKLEDKLIEGEVGTVVATIGTTATGSIDTLEELFKLQKKYNFRIHADAAYGGYFTLINNLNSTNRRSYKLLPQVDSIVIDPHKHGLQPFGCGCILFKDPTVGKFYKHDSPYTYFSSNDLHLGEISLECSRPGAAAVALWATIKLLPLVKDGEFSKMLSNGRKAALKLYEKLKADKRFVVGFEPDLDIVIWTPFASTIPEASKLSRQIFNECAKHNLHLALADLPTEFFNLDSLKRTKDNETVTCLRSVLMKQEHLDWIDHIWNVLDKSTNIVLKKTKKNRFII